MSWPTLGIVSLPLAWLWFRLINNLWPEWNTNPQYSYGLVVPLLVVGLLARRWIGEAESRKQKAESRNSFQISSAREMVSPISQAAFRFPLLKSLLSALRLPFLFSAFRFPLSAFILLSFLYLPTRLVEAATPEWRPLQWLLAIEVIGLTLYAIYLAGGRSWLRQAAFPVIFFLVAVPWPTPIEQPMIQGLSRMNAALVVEVMGILGVPALQHGNVIEVATGMVGVNDACSGIRSFQSSLMISLFLGEFFRFIWRRRLLLLLMGFVLALGLNLCRASLLTWIAAKKGTAAIAEYHDQAGFAIVVVCSLSLWVLAAWLNHRDAHKNNENADGRKQKVESDGSGAAGIEQEPAVATPNSKLSTPNPQLPAPSSHVSRITYHVSRLSSLPSLSRFSLVLIVWLVLVEIGVGLWYHFRESNHNTGPTWTVNFPVDNPTFKEMPLTAEATELLRFDQGKTGRWQEPDGTTWQSFYFNWQPGRVAGYLAKRHTPEICLTASGLKMTAGPSLEIMNVHGVELPMRCYTFDSSSGPLQVFQCRWEAGVDKESYTAQDLTRFNLIRGVWAGRGNQGQKVLEIIITGMNDPAQARAAMIRQLESLITVSAVESPHPDSPR